MNSKLDKINESFNRGVLPKGFDFSVINTDTIDFNKIKYNAFYKSYEFAESKFANGYGSIPGFEKIIESCICQQSPLEEYNDRVESKIEKNNKQE